MRGFLAAFCGGLTWLGLAALPAAAAPALMPAPKTITTAAGELSLPGRFRTDLAGCPGRIGAQAVGRFQTDLARLAGFAPGEDGGPALRVTCGSDPGYLSLQAREAYRLEITSAGVSLRADGPTGVLRGLATLRQLVELGPRGPAVPFVQIEDAPRFAWRGVMIDVARHFMSIPTLERQIDAMERVKLNVLHLHLSDNEAFRVASRRYPRLQAVAAHGQFYSQAQVRALVAYAADRGVRIVPEFDLPAHSGAILAAYPELAAATAPGDALAAANPAIDPASEATYRFVSGLYGEMANLFPDRYFHVGGDEVGDQAWSHDPKVMALMAARGLTSRTEVEAYFHRRVRAILDRYGKTVIGWQEIAATPIPDDEVVQAWRTSNATGLAVAAGHPTVVSAGYYLDLLEPAARHYAVDPYDLEADGFTHEEMERVSRAGPLAAAVAKGLELQPLPPLTGPQRKLVLGGEMALWSELVSDEMLDARLWPRAAALAERFWSPAEVRDPADLYRRLPIVEDRLELEGLEARANRARMAARLAPGQTDVVLTLLGAVGPVRNGAHNRSIRAFLRGQLHPPPQRLVALADAAPVDSLAARRFEAQARRLVAGDRAAAGPARAQLEAWRDNHPRFALAAVGRPALEAALPVSAQVAELAQIGLSALAAVEGGRPMTAADLERAHEALDRATAAEKASSRPIFALMQPPQPADLVIAITPGVRVLVEAARPAARPGVSP